jgi:hypothetical protein
VLCILGTAAASAQQGDREDEIAVASAPCLDQRFKVGRLRAPGVFILRVDLRKLACRKFQKKLCFLFGILPIGYFINAFSLLYSSQILFGTYNINLRS